MESDNPFTPPRVELIDASAALEGWSRAQLTLLGWLSLASVLGSTLLLVMGLAEPFLADFPLGALGQWLAPLMSLLACYLWLQLKRLAERRFSVVRLGWPVTLVLAGNLLLALLDLLWADGALVGWRVFVYFGVLSAYGAAVAWLGMRLRRGHGIYTVYSVLAWLCIVGGIMAASVILMVLAVVPLLGVGLAMALVFFQAATEVRERVGPVVSPRDGSDPGPG